LSGSETEQAELAAVDIQKLANIASIVELVIARATLLFCFETAF
jgi:hypothetical protein